MRFLCKEELNNAGPKSSHKMLIPVNVHCLSSFQIRMDLELNLDSIKDEVEEKIEIEADFLSHGCDEDQTFR